MLPLYRYIKEEQSFYNWAKPNTPIKPVRKNVITHIYGYVIEGSIVVLKFIKEF